MTHHTKPVMCSPYQLTNRILAEIAILLSRAKDFEAEVEVMLKSESLQVRHRRIKSLQEIDILSQSLQSIAILLESLQDEMTKEETMSLNNLMSRIPLHDMTLRLSGDEFQELSQKFIEF